MSESRVCVALDFKNKYEVENFLSKFKEEKLYVKVMFMPVVVLR